MNIVKATRKFEDWLRLQIRLVEPDLRFKHEQMAAALFPFFRATFYRWLQVWPEECASLYLVPQILWVGDLGHAENDVPLIMDSHGGGVDNDAGEAIPCGIHLRPFRQDSWYNRCASHAHRLFV